VPSLLPTRRLADDLPSGRSEVGTWATHLPALLWGPMAPAAPTAPPQTAGGQAVTEEAGSWNVLDAVPEHLWPHCSRQVYALHLLRRMRRVLDAAWATPATEDPHGTTNVLQTLRAGGSGDL